MTFEHLANLMLNWGYEIKYSQYSAFKKYLNDMLLKNRVLLIWNGELIEAVILYFLTNDFRKIYRKGTFEIREDEPRGRQIYIDKLVARKWNKSIRLNLQEAIEKKFPHVTEAYWHRAPKDRCVRIFKKGVYA